MMFLCMFAENQSCMAIITFGDIVTGISGSKKGATYSRNGSGWYVKNKSAPTNPDTQAQQSVRNCFGDSAMRWRTLSDIERESWNQQASTIVKRNALGQSYNPTGYQFYMQIHQILCLLGLPPNGQPPTPTVFPLYPSLMTVDVNNTAQTMELDFTGGIPASFLLIINASTQLSVGKGYAVNTQRFIDAIGFGTIPPYDMYPAWSNVFGDNFPVLGAKIWFSFYWVSLVTGATGWTTEDNRIHLDGISHL